MKKIFKIFKNKKILITGHTGFKGSWLTLWFLKHNARVVGISKDMPTKPSHYKLLNLKKNIKEYFLNIKDQKKIENIFINEKPDFIFHLAAQSIVSKSYNNPFETFESNTFGTLSILESLKKIKKKTYVILITSDKSYKNFEIKRGYKENDILGGDDPYSASKGSAEIIINSYIQSFFKKKNSNIFVSIARAGNVIGGGDWSENRLIPDFIKSYTQNKLLLIRNPNSTRPWQHVIEVIYGYIKLAYTLKKNHKLNGEVFNFGPSLKDKLSVKDIIMLMKLSFKNIKYKLLKKEKNFFKESKLLFLNSNKSARILNWKCILNSKKTLKLTSKWYENYYSLDANKVISLEQLNIYENLLNKK